MNKILDIQFIEVSIRTWLERMDELHLIYHDAKNNMSPDHFTEDPMDMMEDLKREFVFLEHRVINACNLYFELKDVPKYVDKFNSDYEGILNNKNVKGDRIELRGYSLDRSPESQVTTVIRQLLYPVRAFGSGDNEDLTGLFYLENILKSTTRILSSVNCTPTKESDVYNSVKGVVEVVFTQSKAQFLGGIEPFYKKAKFYKPDILIPLLNCAIEYKFAKSIKKLNSTIEEILIDVHGYSNNDVYQYFYAVFYVKSGITTEMSFNEMWSEKEFPKNWIPIYVEGPTT